MDARPAGKPRVLVCIVGGARTLAVPAVHESIRVHVLESLRASAERVDVVSLLIDDDSDAPAFNRGGGSANATRCHGDPTTALKQLGPLVDDLRIKKSDCAHFRTVADDRTADRRSGGGARGVTPARCVDDSLWLQFAWIDMCLRRGMKLAETKDRSTKHSHFIRMRPDSFFAGPLPDLRHFPLDRVTTWLKHDGVGSDMFFLFTRKVFHTWWVREVRRKLTQGVFRECCPEECFKGVKVSHQDRQLKGGLPCTCTGRQCTGTTDEPRGGSLRRAHGPRSRGELSRISVGVRDLGPPLFCQWRCVLGVRLRF